ncbi:hypothetical protein REPUB_Repub03eG0222900 [Reevesia pubescens]
MSTSFPGQEEATKGLQRPTKSTPSCPAVICKFTGEISKLLKPLSESKSKVKSDPDLQENLLTTVLNLFIHGNSKKFISKNPVVTTLRIESLKFGTIEISSVAAALFSVSGLNSNKVIIESSGALVHLLELLRAGHPLAMKDVASALFNICIICENKAEFTEMRTVMVILQKIKDGILFAELVGIPALIYAHHKAIDELGNFYTLLNLLQKRTMKKGVTILYTGCLNNQTLLMMIRGYIPVISTLAKGLDISLNHMVTKLVRRHLVVKVIVKGGATIVANVVIITIPLGVLKVKSIKFEPRLLKWKEAAIDDLGVGIETKIALHFDKVFWLNVGFFRAVADTTSDCSYFLNFNETTSHSVIVYMPTGQLARDIEKIYDEAAMDFTFMLFRQILPKASALIQYLISRWGTNINPLGPYSYDAVGKPNALYERLTIPSGTSPSQETLKALVYGTGIYLSPMHASKEVAHLIFSSLKPYKLNVPEASRDRCLGTAVEVVLAIIQGLSCLFTSLVLAESGADVTLIERGQVVEMRGCDIGTLVVRRTLESESKLCFGKSGASSWNDGKLVSKIGRSNGYVWATWVSYLVTDSLFLEGKIWTQFLLNLPGNVARPTKEKFQILILEDKDVLKSGVFDMSHFMLVGLVEFSPIYLTYISVNSVRIVK